MSRRIAIALLFVTPLAISIGRLTAQGPGDPCGGAGDVRLVGGRIATMDARSTVASGAAIRRRASMARSARYSW